MITCGYEIGILCDLTQQHILLFGHIQSVLINATSHHPHWRGPEF